MAEYNANEFFGAERKMTNGDRIRAASDNEIADWMEDNIPCRQNCPAKRPMCSDRCYNAWLDWLKQEVDT